MSSGPAPESPAELLPAPSFRDAVRGDLAEVAALKESRWPSVGTAVDVLMLPGTWAVILFRLGSSLHNRGLRPLSRLCYFANVVLFGADLHNGAVVQPGLVLPHPNGVAFGAAVRIGARCKLLRHSGAGGAGNPKRPGMPIIGDDVWLLDSAKILGPVTVGDRAMIGANATVADDVPADMFVFGPKKSTEMRPMSEMGLGAEAEREQGYGIAGRNHQRSAVPTPADHQAVRAADLTDRGPDLAERGADLAAVATNGSAGRLGRNGHGG